MKIPAFASETDPLRLPKTVRISAAVLVRFDGMMTLVTYFRLRDPGFGPGFLDLRGFFGSPSKVHPFGDIFGKPPVHLHFGGIVKLIVL